MSARLQIGLLLLTATASAAACGGSARVDEPAELALAAPATPAVEPAHTTPADDVWTRLDVPVELAAGAALTGDPKGGLLLVTPDRIARSADDGRTWEVTPTGRERAFYTTKGGEPWVGPKELADPYYLHGPVDAERETIEAGAGPNRVLTFAVGTHSATVASLPTSAAMGERVERVYLTSGGAIADGISFRGPKLATFDVPARPVLVGTIGSRTTVFLEGDADDEWRAAWRGPEDGPAALAVRMVTADLGYLLLADGTLYETSDGLKTWQVAGTLPPELARRARALTPVGLTGLVVVGSRGLALASTDRGRSWRRSECPDDVDLTAVAAAPDGRVWAVGRAGAVVASFDAGGHFRRVMIPIGRRLTRVVVHDGRAYILAGTALYVSPEPA